VKVDFDELKALFLRLVHEKADAGMNTGNGSAPASFNVVVTPETGLS
jgi:hypothetical protein